MIITTQLEFIRTCRLVEKDSPLSLLQAALPPSGLEDTVKFNSSSLARCSLLLPTSAFSFLKFGPEKSGSGITSILLTDRAVFSRRFGCGSSIPRNTIYIEHVWSTMEPNEVWLWLVPWVKSSSLWFIFFEILYFEFYFWEQKVSS